VGRPERYPHIFDDPEHQQVEFPFAGGDATRTAPSLNDLATHPELIAFVERALGVPDVLLTQAAIWAKYAGTGDFGRRCTWTTRGTRWSSRGTTGRSGR
jgi:hypothetical protein